MADVHQNDYMDEEEDFKTPLHVDKKKRKEKQIASETENHEEDGIMNIKVKEVFEKPNKIPPIVAYFSTGYDPCAVNPESGEKETPKVTVYKHKAESKKRLKVVVNPPDANVEFVGTNYTGEQAARQTCTYRLGVYDKDTKTLTIVPIAHNKIIRLEPRIKTTETVDPEASGSAMTTENSKREQLDKTNSRYGTNKAVTRDKKKRALNVGDDPETQKFLDGKLGEVDVNTSALDSTNSIVARNIPPYDASATTPKAAYPLEKIIEKGDWKFLEDIYWLLGQETGTAPDTYPAFVRNRLYKLRDIEDDDEKKKVCCALSLLTHLIKFKDMNSMNGFDSAKDHKLPGFIRQKCRSLFKDPESERIPVDKTNLLISYVLVLALHVDNFKTDPVDIAKDLRISTIDLRRHFENLGCKLSHEKSSSSLVATLPVPLSFPEIRRRRKTQKR